MLHHYVGHTASCLSGNFLPISLDSGEEVERKLTSREDGGGVLPVDIELGELSPLRVKSLKADREEVLPI